MADILIETEHAVWTLMVRRDDWMEGRKREVIVARHIDARSWLAGTRHYEHLGLIVFDPERTPVAKALVQRYGRSKNSVSLRSGSRSARR